MLRRDGYVNLLVLHIVNQIYLILEQILVVRTVRFLVSKYMRQMDGTFLFVEDAAGGDIGIMMNPTQEGEWVLSETGRNSELQY